MSPAIADNVTLYYAAIVFLRTHIAAILVTLTLLFGQGIASAHIASYDDAPHDHDGMACTVTLLAENADLVAPPPPAPTLSEAHAHATKWTESFVSTTRKAMTARGPPPRAPPH